MKPGGRKQIGLFGGTFSPIHYGHLANAEGAREKGKLDEVIFIPAAQNPFKEKTDPREREMAYEMLKLATEDNDAFSVSRVELDKPGKSYTVDTVRKIKQDHPEDDFYFIMGTDLLYQVETWKEAQTLLSLVDLLVISRPGNEPEDHKKKARELEERFGTNIRLIEIPGVDIASTRIRNMVSRGESVRYLLPDKVLAYINQHGLYREAT